MRKVLEGDYRWCGGSLRPGSKLKIRVRRNVEDKTEDRKAPAIGIGLADPGQHVAKIPEAPANMPHLAMADPPSRWRGAQVHDLIGHEQKRRHQQAGRFRPISLLLKHMIWSTLSLNQQWSSRPNESLVSVSDTLVRVAQQSSSVNLGVVNR